MSGNIEKLIKPGSSFEHVARWLAFCGAQSPFRNVSDKLPSQVQNDSSQLGVSVLVILCVNYFNNRSYNKILDRDWLSACLFVI